MSDLGTQLREYLDATAPPVELEEIITDEVWVPAKDEPRRRRLVVDDAITARTQAGGVAILPGWAYGVAAMAVILLLIFGLTLLVPGSDGNEVVDEPTPTTIDTQPPATTQPQPSTDLSGDSGRLDTALGPIPWVHADEIGLIPHWGEVIQTADGFAGIADEEVSDGRYVSLWITSPDGVTWAEAPFPVPVDPQARLQVGETQGRYWLTDGARLWLSDDAQAWTEVDLSDITPPPSEGVVWLPRLESPAISGHLAVFPLQIHPVLPLQQIFDPGSQYTGGVRQTNCGWDWELDACQEVADDVDVVLGVDADTGEETLLARIRLEAGGEAAHVVDIDSGNQVHEFSIPGFDSEQLTRISGSDLLDWYALALVGSEPTASVVEPPWASFGLRSLFIGSVEDRFVAYVDGGPPLGPTSLDAIEVWESDDGLTWTSHSTADFGVEAPGEVHVDLFERSDHLIANIQFDLSQTLPSEARLISEDGLSWEQYAADAPGWVEQLQDGFVAFGDKGVFVSADGDQWEELSSWNPRNGDSALIAGDTLIVALENEGAFDIWAYDLEP